MAAKVVVTLLVNGQWSWRAEAPIDQECNRRMSLGELNTIAQAAVECVEALVKIPAPAEPTRARAQEPPRRRHQARAA